MIEAEIEVSQGELTQNSSSPSNTLGTKKVKFWSFLQHERVGQEFLLTPKHIKQFAQDVSCNLDYVYQMLYRFEKEGLIYRKVEAGGTMLTFLPKNTGTDKPNKGDAQILSPGEKKIKFWSFLQNRKVDNKLVFTVECAQQATHEVPASRNYCYEMLKSFEKEGLVRRKPMERGQGTMIIFLSKNKEMVLKPKVSNQRKTTEVLSFSETTTFAEALVTLETEIQNLKKKIVEKETLRDQISAMVRREK